MNSAYTGALIAGVISLVVAVISYVANRKALASQARRHEQEMQRRLTEKLYGLRIDCYREAFEITEMLIGDVVFDAGTEDYLKDVHQKLTEWNRTKAGLIMSEGSIKSYYRLRDALAGKTRTGPLDKTQIEKIWKAKNDFRRNLRKDVNLLYVEESKPDEDATRN